MADNLAIEPDLFYGKSKEVDEVEDISTEDAEIDTSLKDDENVSNDTKPDNEDDSNDQDDDSETLEKSDESEVFEVDGVEFTVDQLKEYKQAFDDKKSMQADYTRKTQDIANRAKDEAKKLYESDNEKLKELIATLEAETKLDDVDLDELKEYDEGEYYKQLHKNEKREKLINKAKSELVSKVTNADLQAEQEKLLIANPQWVEDGKATQVYTDDMKLLDDYYKNNNWSVDDVKSVVTAKTYQLILDSAKAKVKADNEVVERKKAAKLLKPKSINSAKKVKASAKEKSLADIFYG